MKPLPSPPPILAQPDCPGCDLGAEFNVGCIPETPIKLGVGFDYSRGDYGFATDTEVLSRAGSSLLRKNWLARLTRALFTVKGPASVHR